MESNRTYSPYRKKVPKVALDGRFAFTKDMKLGDKGQLDCILKIKAIDNTMDSDGNEIQSFRLEIINANPIQENVAKKLI